MRVRRQLDSAGTANRLATIYQQVEALIPEPSDTGIASQMSAFWSSFSEAAARPSDLAARSALLARASTLASSLRSTSESLTSYRTQLLSDTRVRVAQVNSDVAEIASLNTAIVSARAAGVDPGDLQDQRDLLVDRVVSSTGATTKSEDDGSVTVFLGGKTLVRGTRTEALEVTVGGPLDPPLDALPFQQVGLRWAGDGYGVQSLGGSLAADLDGMARVVPTTLAQLDEVAASLVSSVNDLHVTGHGLDPVADVDLTFFDPAGTTAATIAISADVAGQPSRIALADALEGDLGGALGHQIAALADQSSGPDASFRNLVGRLGVEAQTAASSATIAEKISQQVQQERQAMTGVNLDEELTALVASQRAYEAAARILTAADEMLDQLINRTGVVGR
jgi:flagellar hook-associated protein 1 FlgK